MTAKPQWEYDLKYKFGITGDQYRELLAGQGGRCKFCGRKPGKYRLSVDHDHACCPKPPTCGNCNRGLLCSDCNQILLGRICQEGKLGKEHAIGILRTVIEHIAGNDSHLLSLGS